MKFLLLFLLVPPLTRARFPNKYPLIDTCSGLAEPNCVPNSAGGACAWFTNQYPWCFNHQYAMEHPKTIDILGLSSKFFHFSAGVHLSEGTHQKFFVNLSPDECAAECLQSPSVCPANVRCLSFDFYPYESPLTEGPWYESYERGICVLNTENSDSARIRNSDLGYSDASLFYRSHFSYLPFSDAEGHYELRDPRGNILSTMLDYNDLTASIPATFANYGGSRWGIYSLKTPTPVRQDVPSQCPPIGPAPVTPYVPPRYYGGYTPVDKNQKCAGLVTRTQAEALCAYSGGYLCTNAELDALVGVKLGCGFDGPVRGTTLLTSYPIWSSEDRSGSTELKFARCCASYALLDSCDAYQSPACPVGQPDCPYTCAKYTTATECVQQASGTARQNAFGMGIFIDQIRQDCQRDPTRCKGEYLDWTPRDQCVWCPAPGDQAGGGAGECRVGSSLAICPNAPSDLRVQWTAVVQSQCTRSPTGTPVSTPEILCRLIANYPDLASDLMAPPEPPPIPTTATTAAPTPTFRFPPSRCNSTTTSITPPVSIPPVGNCYQLRTNPTLCNQRPDCEYKKGVCKVRVRV